MLHAVSQVGGATAMTFVALRTLVASSSTSWSTSMGTGFKAWWVTEGGLSTSISESFVVDNGGVVESGSWRCSPDEESMFTAGETVVPSSEVMVVLGDKDVLNEWEVLFFTARESPPCCPPRTRCWIGELKMLSMKQIKISSPITLINLRWVYFLFFLRFELISWDFLPDQYVWVWARCDCESSDTMYSWLHCVRCGCGNLFSTCSYPKEWCLRPSKRRKVSILLYSYHSTTVTNYLFSTRYCSIDFIIFAALVEIILPWIFITYNIGCQWLKNFCSRMSDFPESMQLNPATKVDVAIPS